MSSIQVRREVLEYGAVPLSSLIPELETHTDLQDLHSRLHSVSSINSQGVRIVAAQDVSKYVSHPDQHLRLLAECIQSASPHQSCFYNEQHELAAFALYDLSIYLFAELYGREAVRPEATDHWPEPSTSSGDGRSTSPNPKSGGSSKTLLRQQLQQHLKQQEQQIKGFSDYVKRNLKKLLLLVLDKPQPPSALSEPHVTPQEFDRLTFLLQPPRPAPEPATDPRSRPTQPPPPIHTLLPIFQSAASTPIPTLLPALSASMTTVTDYAPRFAPPSNGLSSIKIQRELGLVGSAGHVDEATVQGLYRGTVVRGEADFPTGELHIMDCHDAVVYALAPLQRVMVSGCSDCTVILGAVGAVLRVEKCDKVMVVAAASRCIINTCHDCTFHLGVNTPPALIGDNRFITLAPHNVRYERLTSHIRAAGLRSDAPNLWNAPLLLHTSPHRRSIHRPESPRWQASSSPASAPDSPLASASPSKSPVALLPPEDFLPYTVPFKGCTGTLAGGPSTYSSVKWSSVGSKHHSLAPSSFPFPLPPDYEAALAAKHAYVSQLRGSIKSAVLEEGRRRELQAGIQAFFREWLGSSNNIRQVYDLSKLEGDDPAGPAASSSSAGGPSPSSSSQ